ERAPEFRRDRAGLLLDLREGVGAVQVQTARDEPDLLVLVCGSRHCVLLSMSPERSDLMTSAASSTTDRSASGSCANRPRKSPSTWPRKLASMPGCAAPP